MLLLRRIMRYTEQNTFQHVCKITQMYVKHRNFGTFWYTFIQWLVGFIQRIEICTISLIFSSQFIRFFIRC